MSDKIETEQRSSRIRHELMNIFFRQANIQWQAKYVESFSLRPSKRDSGKEKARPTRGLQLADVRLRDFKSAD